MIMWKLSITTPSNLYADGIILRVNRSTFIETDRTLTGAPKGRFVTLRSEDPKTLIWVMSQLHWDIEVGRVTRIELSQESGR